MGGKVNNRTVSIREQLHNGDIVEILTQKNQTPKSDWLNFVVVGLLGEGVASSTAFDAQAKGLGEYLRSRVWR